MSSDNSRLNDCIKEAFNDFDLKLIKEFMKLNPQYIDISSFISHIIKDYLDGKLVYKEGNVFTPILGINIDQRIIQKYKIKAKEAGVSINTLMTFALVKGLSNLEPEKYCDKKEIYRVTTIREPGQKIKCPKCDCQDDMEIVNINDLLEIDLCQQCGGIWLDYGELKELIRNEETIKKSFDFAQITTEKTPEEVDYQLCSCPVCIDVELEKLPHKRSVGSYVRLLVDRCPVCGGYFLDQGEYGKISTPDMLAELRRYLVLL